MSQTGVFFLPLCTVAKRAECAAYFAKVFPVCEFAVAVWKHLMTNISDPPGSNATYLPGSSVLPLHQVDWWSGSTSQLGDQTGTHEFVRMRHKEFQFKGCC